MSSTYLASGEPYQLTATPTPQAAAKLPQRSKMLCVPSRVSLDLTFRFAMHRVRALNGEPTVLPEEGIHKLAEGRVLEDTAQESGKGKCQASAQFGVGPRQDVLTRSVVNPVPLLTQTTRAIVDVIHSADIVLREKWDKLQRCNPTASPTPALICRHCVSATAPSLPTQSVRVSVYLPQHQCTVSKRTRLHETVSPENCRSCYLLYCCCTDTCGDGVVRQNAA